MESNHLGFLRRRKGGEGEERKPIQSSGIQSRRIPSSRIQSSSRILQEILAGGILFRGRAE